MSLRFKPLEILQCLIYGSILLGVASALGIHIAAGAEVSVLFGDRNRAGLWTHFDNTFTAVADCSYVEGCRKKLFTFDVIVFDVTEGFVSAYMFNMTYTDFTTISCPKSTSCDC